MEIHHLQLVPPFPYQWKDQFVGEFRPARSHNSMSTPVEITNPRCPPRRSNDTSAHGGFREHGECYWMSLNVSFLHEFSLLAVHKLISSFFSCILLSQFFLTSLNKTCHKSSCNIICFVLSSSMKSLRLKGMYIVGHASEHAEHVGRFLGGIAEWPTWKHARGMSLKAWWQLASGTPYRQCRKQRVVQNATSPAAKVR